MQPLNSAIGLLSPSFCPIIDALRASFVGVWCKQAFIPHGLVVRIRRFHRRGPGSIPSVGKQGDFYISAPYANILGIADEITLL